MSKPKKNSIKETLKTLPKISLEDLVKTQLEKGGWPGPVKPEKKWKEREMGKKIKGKTQTGIVKVLSDAVSDATKEWNVDQIFADIKYRGVRGILLIEPKKNRVRIISRNFKEDTMDKFSRKFGRKILSDLNVSATEDEPLVIDSELWGTLEGKFIDQGTINGFIKAPENKEAYKKIKPIIEAFDIYMLQGKDIRSLELKDRKELLDMVISENDVILRDADVEFIKNDPQEIEKRFKNVIKDGNEGLVIKKPNEPVFGGKAPQWLKLKSSETIDLEIKQVTKKPRDSSDEQKPFRYYGHWSLVPSDNEDAKINADKGFPGSGMDWEWYAEFTRKILKMIKQGKAIPSKKMVPVDSKFKKEYGVSQVPESVSFDKGNRLIAEIYAEDISPKLSIPGSKIIGLREDKDVGDSTNDIERVRDLLYGEVAEINTETAKKRTEVKTVRAKRVPIEKRKAKKKKEKKKYQRSIEEFLTVKNPLVKSSSEKTVLLLKEKESS